MSNFNELAKNHRGAKLTPGQRKRAKSRATEAAKMSGLPAGLTKFALTVDLKKAAAGPQRVKFAKPATKVDKVEADDKAADATAVKCDCGCEPDAPDKDCECKCHDGEETALTARKLRLKLVSKFGSKLGMKYYAQGLTLKEATVRFNAAVNAARKRK